MTRDDDFIGQVEAYLDEFEGMTPLPNAVRNAVRAQLPETRQLGRFGGPMRRFDFMNNNIVRVGIAAAVIVLAVIVGINLLPGPNTGGPDATPSPSAVSLPFTRDSRPIEAGTYRLLGETWAPVDLTLTVPAGWNQDYLGVAKNPDSDTGLSLQAWVVTQVYTDTCAADGQLLPIGPSVDDLVNALEALGGAEVSPPAESLVGGSPATRVDLLFAEAINLADCREPALQVWKNADEEGYNAGVPGSSQSVYVMDVQGQTVAIVTSGSTTTASAADLAELQAVIDSIQIEPAR